MTLWKVDEHFMCDNGAVMMAYVVKPEDWSLRHYLEWYGIKGLRRCYLFKKQAEHAAAKLNKRAKPICEPMSSDAALAFGICLYLAKYIKQGSAKK